MVQQVVIVACHDGASWAAWSPQCPGLSIVEHTIWQLRQAVPDALRFYFEGRPFKIVGWEWDDDARN